VPNATLVGRIIYGNAVFVHQQVAQVLLRGQMRPAGSISYWTLKANGDALTGEIVRQIEGVSPRGAPTPVTGTRVK